MKKGTLRVTAFLVVMCMCVGCLAACGQNNGSANQGELTVKSEVLDSLGLCFTEGHFANRTEEAVRQRCKEYAAMGLKTLRVETAWVSLMQGSWIMSGETEYTLKAAVDAGLRLKLISPTIMMPQSWVTNDPDSALVDQNGMKAVNTLSYWYDGIYDYTRDAIEGQLAVYEEMGFLDDIDALIVDFGPAGEPLYPSAWTQTGNLEDPNNETTGLWCYGENAVADFRTEMLEKYGSIDKVNEAWGTNYTSMDEYQMPMPGTVKGTQWGDILTWYVESKREFVEKQIQVFQEAVEKYSDGRIQLILYMPGASYSEAEWNENVAAGTATFAMRIASENEFMVQMADKYGCLLQFTGLPGIGPLKQVREYMYANGYGHIPVFGENYADYASSCDPVALYKVIEELNLAGIDYTFSKFLYEDNGVTHSAIYPIMEQALPMIDAFVKETDHNVVPATLSQAEPAPEGDALILDLTLDDTIDSDIAQLYMSLEGLLYEIQPGDVLEYDVKISVPARGYGFVDADMLVGGTLREVVYCTDQFGATVHPQSDLSLHAGGQWMHRVINLDVPYSTYNPALNTTGKTMQNLLLSCQPYRVNGSFDYTEVTVYYDNIRITNGGEVKLNIFTNAGDWDISTAVIQRSYGMEGILTVGPAEA